MKPLTLACPNKSTQMELVRLSLINQYPDAEFVYDFDFSNPSVGADVDAVILEPSLTDWEWLRCLMQFNNRFPHIPVILYSLDASDGEEIQPLDVQLSVYITDDVKLLSNKFDRILQRKAQSQKRILFVDDDELVLNSYARMLRSKPWKIVTAPGAMQALALLEQESMDLVVTDIKMPEIHGIELIGKIRAIDDSLPIVACSAYPGMKDDDDLKYYHTSAFVEKPVDADILIETIEGLLT
ncbi:hypothetical protein D1BOALGB6SA_910 [Olavius sp. associated proteobacterium Delta 1]|nr:hypothetical protein D1BOALGB6SA_910 [Olavius sp. associated proteobacterium Delta 1]